MEGSEGRERGKRRRRMKKEEKVRNEQELIALGLKEAPKPRLTMNSYMHAMKNEGVSDPSKLERDIKKQVV